MYPYWERFSTFERRETAGKEFLLCDSVFVKPTSSTAVSHQTGKCCHSLWNQCLLLCSCSPSALWFHNTVALQFGVGVNVFWRHLPADSYDRKDPYGNKDPVAAARALQAIDRALHALDELPAVYRDFYGRRMIQRIQTRTFCDRLNNAVTPVDSETTLPSSQFTKPGWPDTHELL